MSRSSRFDFTPVVAVILVLAATLHPSHLQAARDDLIGSWVEILQDQLAVGKPLPAASLYGLELTLDEAYLIQQRLLATVGADAEVTGYSADFTALRSRLGRRTDQPIVSPIVRVPGRRWQWQGDGRVLVKPGLAFRLTRRVDRPIPDVARLKPLIRDVRPAVELRRINWEDPLRVSSADAAAMNVGPAKVALGRVFDFVHDGTVNEAFVELAIDGAVIDRGKARNVMGDQFEALRWLVNTVVESGRAIEPGQILLTGAFGDAVFAAPGRWAARFRESSELEFLVPRR